MAETNLENKEQENAALQDQVQQYEARWVEYEGKMKLMEDMWQKQTASLQVSSHTIIGICYRQQLHILSTSKRGLNLIVHKYIIFPLLSALDNTSRFLTGRCEMAYADEPGRS